MIYGWPAAIYSLVAILVVVGVLAAYVVPLLVMVHVWETRPRTARALLVFVILLALVGIGVSAAVFGVPVRSDR